MARDPFQISIAVPFEEAIAAARRRRVVLPEVFYGHLPAAARSRAFTVSGLAALDQVQGVMDSLKAATESGQTFRDWKKAVLADVPDLGKLPADRLDNIFRTAIQTHYNIGRWEQLEGNKARRPYLMYDAINDGRTRPAHRAMDNHIAPIDDPIWSRWYPPNGFRCRCSVIGLTEAQARARGYGRQVTPGAEPDKGWDYHPAKGQDEALRKVIDSRQKDCAGAGRTFAGTKDTGVPCGARGRVYLDRLRDRLRPVDVAEQLREALGVSAWERFSRHSAAARDAFGLAEYEAVALTGYTDRELATLINGLARCLSDRKDVPVPADFLLARWLILGLDSGLARLPARAGTYYRGVAVDGMPSSLRDDFLSAHGRRGTVVQYFGYTSGIAGRSDWYSGSLQILRSLSARDLSSFSLSGEAEFLHPRRAVFEVEKPMKADRPSVLRETTLASGLIVKRGHQFSPDQVKSLVPELSDAELDALVEAQVRVSEEWLASGGVVSERMQRHIERTTAELMAGSPGHEPKPWDPK